LGHKRLDLGTSGCDLFFKFADICPVGIDVRGAHNSGRWSKDHQSNEKESRAEKFWAQPHQMKSGSAAFACSRIDAIRRPLSQRHLAVHGFHEGRKLAQRPVFLTAR